jgi:hypothetical protein
MAAWQSCMNTLRRFLKSGLMLPSSSRYEEEQLLAVQKLASCWTL